MASTLNERQMALLRQLVDGVDRPTGADAGTVYALRSRGLVTTTSTHFYWSATPTDRGREFIESGDAGSERINTVPGSPVELLEQLTASAADHLMMTNPTAASRAQWQRLIHATRVAGVVGAATVLRHRGRDHGDCTVWLEPRTDPSAAPKPAAVPVPQRVRRPHPLIAALRSAHVDHDGWINTRHAPGVAHVRVHKSSKQQTIRVIHALTLEAQRRGYTTDTGTGHNCPGGLGITIDGHWPEITISEESTRVEHILTAREQRNQDRGYGWARRWDHQPSGRLVLHSGHGSYGSTLAADRTRWRLDDRLGHAMNQLERLAVEAEARRLARLGAQQRAEQRQLEERRAAEEARWLRARMRHIDAQIERWQHAAAIREFVTAARNNEPVEPAVDGWLRWANENADTIDPTVVGIHAHAASVELGRT